MNQKNNLYGLKKEVTLKLSQRIGDMTFEIEAKRGEEKIELCIRDEEAQQIWGLGSLESYELGRVAHFFFEAQKEVEELNK